MEAVELVEGAGEGGGPASRPKGDWLPSGTVMVAICRQMLSGSGCFQIKEI